MRRRTSRKTRHRADLPVTRKGYRALHDNPTAGKCKKLRRRGSDDWPFFSADQASLPHRPERTLVSSTRCSPYTSADSSTYTAGEKHQELEPQEMMGIGLTSEEFNRRTNSRSPALSVEGPFELASQRFSAVNPKDVDEEPSPGTRPGRRRERQSRLRSSPGIRDLRVEASRSPSANPAGRLLPGGWYLRITYSIFSTNPMRVSRSAAEKTWCVRVSTHCCTYCVTVSALQLVQGPFNHFDPIMPLIRHVLGPGREAISPLVKSRWVIVHGLACLSCLHSLDDLIRAAW